MSEGVYRFRECENCRFSYNYRATRCSSKAPEAMIMSEQAFTCHIPSHNWVDWWGWWEEGQE